MGEFRGPLNPLFRSNRNKEIFTEFDKEPDIVVAQYCNLSTEEAEAGRFQIPRPAVAMY